MSDTTPAKLVKAFGFKSLKEYSEYVKTPLSTIHDQYKSNYGGFCDQLKAAVCQRLSDEL